MSTELVDPMASVRAYLEAEKSANTRTAYASDFAHFRKWCLDAGEEALPAPPIVVARYLAHLADSGLKASTVARRIAAIRSVHKVAGLEPPTNAEGVKAVMRGIRRTHKVAPVRKQPLTIELLSSALDALSDSLAHVRDRAILLVGFAAALRRSEIVALQLSDIVVQQDGIVLHIRGSKTDQEGQGVAIPIARGGRLRTVESLEAWLAAASIKDGPIFREVDRRGYVGSAALSDRTIARIVKRTLVLIGVDPADFSGHSLRSGFVTTALDNNIDTLKLMKITRHAKVDTLKIYDRRRNDFGSRAGGEFL